MQRNAETIAKINIAVATVGSDLWRAMLPGQVNRPKATLRVVMVDTIPVGPAELYCQLRSTRQVVVTDPKNIPKHKCFYQLGSKAYRTRDDSSPTWDKTSLPPREWAMNQNVTIIKAFHTRRNITTIEIASGAQ